MKRRLGDRRTKSRFEIIGDLWGTLDTTATLVVRNLGTGGALLESPLPLTPDSVHWVSAVIDGSPQPMRLRVRHSSKTATASADSYLVGVEFMTLTDVTREFIQQQMLLGSHIVAPAEGV